MNRPVTLFTGQWADLTFEDILKKAREFGYSGVELACWGDHIEVDKADMAYCKGKIDLLNRYELSLYAISTHLVGQAVSDRIDDRHKSILPDYIWGDGDPEGVNERASEEVVKTAKVAKMLGIDIVNGFTGSPIWHLLYAFPPLQAGMIDKGYLDFANRWIPILDEYKNLGIKFGLEVHPTEIAFDIVTAERALKALDYHPAFGFNYDPSHLAYQGVDYIEFIYEFAERIFHVHMKDASWSDTPARSGVFGGNLDFGDRNRYWDFRSVGRGKIDFNRIIRALNDIGYNGPLSVEWEDSGMDREDGATESCEYVKKIDFVPGNLAFDSAFEKD